MALGSPPQSEVGPAELQCSLKVSEQGLQSKRLSLLPIIKEQIGGLNIVQRFENISQQDWCYLPRAISHRRFGQRIAMNGKTLAPVLFMVTE